MATLYVDSSVLVKRHIVEVGSAWFRTQADTAASNTIIIAEVSIIEVLSAFNRRVREGTVTPARYLQLRSDFDALCRTQYQIVALSAGIYQSAHTLLETHPLRAYDAVQLATALAANDALISDGVPALTFIAADGHLLQAAAASGLAVDNPNAHP